MARKVLGRALIRYYLSLRMGAALAVPDLSSREIPIPAPIVRQLPTRIRDGWDERELICTRGTEFVLVHEPEPEAVADFIWN